MEGVLDQFIISMILAFCCKGDSPALKEPQSVALGDLDVALRSR